MPAVVVVTGVAPTTGALTPAMAATAITALLKVKVRALDEMELKLVSAAFVAVIKQVPEVAAVRVAEAVALESVQLFAVPPAAMAPAQLPMPSPVELQRAAHFLTQLPLQLLPLLLVEHV